MSEISQDAPQTPAPNEVPVTSQGKDEGQGTFTQADVDRIVGERAKRAQETARKALLEDLGLSDVDSLKSLVEDARKRKEADMTEAEKARAELEKAQAKIQEAQAELARMKAQQIESARASTIKRALQSSGAQDVDELHILINAQKSDALNAIFSDGGTDADDAKLQAFVKQAQSDYARYFASAGAGSPSNAGGISPTSKAKALQEAQREILRKTKL